MRKCLHSWCTSSCRAVRFALHEIFANEKPAIGSTFEVSTHDSLHSALQSVYDRLGTTFRIAEGESSSCVVHFVIHETTPGGELEWRTATSLGNVARSLQLIAM